MRHLCAFILLTLSFSALAETSAEKMLKVANDAGVGTWGRRKWQEFSLECRIPKHASETNLECHLKGDGVSEEYLGEDAVYISNLLNEYHVRPYGQYKKQDADVQCFLINPRKSDKKDCHIVDYDTVVIP